MNSKTSILRRALPAGALLAAGASHAAVDVASVTTEISSNVASVTATGGLVSGPGTSTSDSIPARLSAGEYVLRAAAVRRLGVDFLHALNGGLSVPRWQGVRLAFAEGGLVPPAPASSPGAGQSVRIVNVIDPSLAADYLTSPAGEKSILNILSRNGSAVREILR